MPNGYLKYRLLITYDGTRYSGWQVQPHAPSIQGTLEDVLARLLRAPCRVVGAGRTDAGVHALGQVAHFYAPHALTQPKFLHALNSLLPPDIRVSSMESIPDSFHAQYSALSKEYHYHLWLEETIDPFLRLYRYHFRDSRWNLSRLEEGIPYFLGTHDFATFTNVGTQTGSTVRTLSRLEILPQTGGIRIECVGSGFLYKMVRNIVGTLLEVSIGKKSPGEIPSLFDARDRRVAGAGAPPTGLFLVDVSYP